MERDRIQGQSYLAGSLTPAGREQAVEAAGRLAVQAPEAVVIVASDLATARRGECGRDVRPVRVAMAPGLPPWDTPLPRATVGNASITSWPGAVHTEMVAP